MMAWKFDYFTEGVAMGAINKLIDGWNATGVPVETRLAEALHKLEQAHNDRLRLQWKVHCQRRALREHWEIVEMRAQYKRCWYPSKLLSSILRNRLNHKTAHAA